MADSFRHYWYQKLERYPNDVADIAGHWAESRIFGGVVIFDQRDPTQHPNADPDAIWLFPDCRDVSYRLFQLLEEQKQQFLQFLLAELPNLELFPILDNETNAVREDPEEECQTTGIYRNDWERSGLSDEEEGDSKSRTCSTTFDYPTWSDLMRAKRRARDRRDYLLVKAGEKYSV